MRVRFDAIGDAWRLYMADVGQWFLSVLLLIVVTAAPAMLISMLVGMAMSPGWPSQTVAASPAGVHASQTSQLVSTFILIPVNIVSQLLATGILRRGILQLRGLPAPIGEIFNLEGRGMAVLGYGCVYVLMWLPGQIYYAFAVNPSNPFSIFDPGRLAVGAVISLVLAIIQLAVRFAPLLIVDQKMGLLPALNLSATTFMPRMLPLLGVTICAGLLSCLGALACGIGVLFTIPVFYAVYSVIYNDFFRPAPSQPTFETYYPRP